MALQGRRSAGFGTGFAGRSRWALIKEGDDYTVLTDIAGVEDHLGDMDFKVAGTKEGITALQMDIKITGVTLEILRDAMGPGQQGPAVHSRQDGRIDRTIRARSSRSLLPRSPRSRSTRRRSAP